MIKNGGVRGGQTAVSPRLSRFETVHRYAIRVLAVCFSLYVLFEINTFTLPPFQERAIFLLFALALCFLQPWPGSDGSKRRRPFRVLLDSTFAALGIIACTYIVVDYDGLINRMGTPTTLDIVMGALGTVLVLEATRRMIGWPLPAIATMFVLYAYYGGYLPTYLGGHGGYSVSRILTQSFLTMEGIFGIALTVMFTYVFPFVFFGVVLQSVGALGFAIDLGQAIFGRFRGGPAKVAVVSSGLIGMINGSAVANVVTGGSITIPMMKKIGFQPHVAGAVEAVASTGGQLIPPVMGAAAFVMAELLGIPYLEIAAAALIPGLLFYVALFTTIHFYSVRHGIGGLSPSSPGAQVIAILKRPQLFLFVLPVGCLVGLMLSGYSPPRAASYALIVIFVTGLFVRGGRLTPRRIVRVLETAAYNSTSLSCASASVGIVIGVTVMTALGSRFASIIIELSGGNIYAALVLVMFSSVILGLGLPTTICYLLLATLAAPALVNLGILPIAAHMFILYFGMMSMVTPPTALAAYAGAAIAEADVMRTGFTAWRFALSGYLLPFMFVLNPAFLMIGPTGGILLAAWSGTIGVMALAAAVIGHVRTALARWERTVVFLGAVTLIHPGWITDLVGLALLLPVAARQYEVFGTRSASAARSA